MKKIHRVKRLKNGMAMLNIGCGKRTHWEWNNLDFSLYTFLAHHKIFSRILGKIGLLSSKRSQNIAGIDPDIISWDLRKGIPFDDNTFDVVYHSHVAEHFDKDIVIHIFKECLRVLKPGGITRVTVPDLQAIINSYTSAVSRLEKGDNTAMTDHQHAVDDLFYQMVVPVPPETAAQPPLVRFIELMFTGGTARSGGSHRWMYDKYNLKELLLPIGFTDIQTYTASTSKIAGWERFNLDTNADGSIHKPGSLYMEGQKSRPKTKDRRPRTKDLNI